MIVRYWLVSAVFLFFFGFGWPNGSPAQDLDRTQSPADVKREVEPGVWVVGKAHRFAELGAVDSFALSPDGMTIAVGGPKIRLFDVEENKIRDSFGEPGEYYRSVEYSPDGRTLVALTHRNAESVIRVWDAIDQSLITTINPSAGIDASSSSRFYIQNLTVSSEGSFVAGSSYNRIVVCDLKTGELLEDFDKLQYVQAMAFTPDEKHFVFPKSNRLKVIDIETGDEVSKADAPYAKSTGNVVAVNHSRNRLAVLRGNAVQIYDLENGSAGQTQSLPSGSYGQMIEFSDDGQLLAISIWERTSNNTSQMGILIMDCDSGRVIKSLKGVGQNVNRIRFSSDNQNLFYTGYGIYGLNMIDLNSDVEVAESNYPKSPANLVTFDSDNTSFVTWAMSGEINVFDLESGQISSSMKQSAPRSMALSGDGDSVLLMPNNGQGQIVKHSLRTGKVQKTYSVKPTQKKTLSILRNLMSRGGTRNVRNNFFGIAMAVSPEQDEFYAFGMEMTMVTSGDWMTGMDYQQKNGLRFISFDADGGSVVRSTKIDNKQMGFSENEWVQSGAVSDNGRWVAVQRGGKVWIIDSENGEVVHEIDGTQQGSNISSLKFSPNSKFLLTADMSGKVSLWDPESAENVHTFDLGNGNGQMLTAFSNNGDKVVVSGSLKESSVKIFDTESGKLLFEKDGSLFNRKSVGVSDDGNSIVLGLSDCRMEIWDVAVLK